MDRDHRSPKALELTITDDQARGDLIPAARAFELLPRHFYLASELSHGFGTSGTFARCRQEEPWPIVASRRLFLVSTPAAAR